MAGSPTSVTYGSSQELPGPHAVDDKRFSHVPGPALIDAGALARQKAQLRRTGDGNRDDRLHALPIGVLREALLEDVLFDGPAPTGGGPPEKCEWPATVEAGLATTIERRKADVLNGRSSLAEAKQACIAELNRLCFGAGVLETATWQVNALAPGVADDTAWRQLS